MSLFASRPLIAARMPQIEEDFANARAAAARRDDEAEPEVGRPISGTGSWPEVLTKPDPSRNRGPISIPWA